MNPNGHYNPVKAAYDAGSQTGETSVGVDVSYSGTTAYLNSGPSLVYGLWNNTYSQTNYKVNFEQPAISEASISFTGNVASDFAGHLLYHQTGQAGTEAVITSLISTSPITLRICLLDYRR
jgi:hypothetical protein